MEEIAEGTLVPIWLQRLLSLTLTVLAAILYAVILGAAILRTLTEGDPVFAQGTVRMASLLSGLVGSVVTAGFARGRRPASVPVSIGHPVDERIPSGWVPIARPPLAKVKLLGLAATLGLRVALPLPPQPSPDEEERDATEPDKLSAAVWVALLYFAVYFLVGGSALVVSLLRPAVPELILNASWVWLGTVVSSGYSFFALSS